MRKVEVKADLPLAPSAVWQLLTEVKNYPKYIKYCWYASTTGPLKQGSLWWDWTTIMVLPLKVDHQVVELIPNEKLCYLVPLKFGGSLTQTVTLTPNFKGTAVKIEVLIDLNNKLLEFLIGNFLFGRTQAMIEGIYTNFQKHYGQNR